MHGLTLKQENILQFLFKHISTLGFAPSLREIGKEFEISSLRGVTVHLDALQRKGMITRTQNARCITITDAGKSFLGAVPAEYEQLILKHTNSVLRGRIAHYRELRKQAVPGQYVCDRMIKELIDVVIAVDRNQFDEVTP